MPYKVLKSSSLPNNKALRTLFKRLIFNPFYIYSIVVVTALLLYSLKWSNYPSLSRVTYLFFGLTALLAFFLGSRINPMQESKVVLEPPNLWKISLFFTMVLSVGFLVLYLKGGVPLVRIIFSSDDYNYQNFRGVRYISTLVMYGYTSLFCIWVNAWWVYRKKRMLALMGIALIHMVLMASRGYTMLVLIPTLFISIYYLKPKVKYVVSTLLAGLVMMFVFGIFGDFRETAKDRDGKWNFYNEYKGDNYPSIIPDEFLWSYFYFTSPIGKFQYTLEDDSINALPSDIGALVTYQLMPYSFGNRINAITHFQERTSSNGYPGWFVGTAYMGPYMYAKWAGVVFYTLMMFGYLWLLYRWSMKYLGPWSIPVLANLSMFMLLSIFDNMLVFAPINFQIWGTMILGFFLQRKRTG